MPNVDITLASGRTPEQIRAVLREVHAAVERTTGARSEHIRVVVTEVPRTHWSTDDTTIAERDASLPAPTHPDRSAAAAPATNHQE